MTYNSLSKKIMKKKVPPADGRYSYRKRHGKWGKIYNKSGRKTLDRAIIKAEAQAHA